MVWTITVQVSKDLSDLKISLLCSAKNFISPASLSASDAGNMFSAIYLPQNIPIKTQAVTYILFFKSLGESLNKQLPQRQNSPK